MPCGTVFGVEIGGGTDAGASGTIGRAVSEARVEWAMAAVKRVVSEAAVAPSLPLPFPCLLHCRQFTHSFWDSSDVIAVE
jgi:hypothetical protein